MRTARNLTHATPLQLGCATVPALHRAAPVRTPDCRCVGLLFRRHVGLSFNRPSVAILVVWSVLATVGGYPYVGVHFYRDSEVAVLILGAHPVITQASGRCPALPNRTNSTHGVPWRACTLKSSTSSSEQGCPRRVSSRNKTNHLKEKRGASLWSLCWADKFFGFADSTPKVARSARDCNGKDVQDVYRSSDSRVHTRAPTTPIHRTHACVHVQLET